MAPNMVDSDLGRMCVWSADQRSGLKVTLSRQQQQLTIVTKNLRWSEPIAWLLLSTPICIQDQSPAANVLQLEARPWHSISRCVFDPMGGRVTILILSPPFCLIL